jgi:hypothetical protein
MNVNKGNGEIDAKLEPIDKELTQCSSFAL